MAREIIISAIVGAMSGLAGYLVAEFTRKWRERDRRR